MMPALEGLIGQRDDDCDVKGKEALQRFQFVFSKLVRVHAWCQWFYFSTTDLQWSDPASLSLLRMVLESEAPSDQASSLLVICAFRDEELETQRSKTARKSSAGTTNPFLHGLEYFTTFVSSSELLNPTTISLSNLDAVSTKELVTANLNVAPDLGDKLGSIVYTKCNGNPFHIMQLLGPVLQNNAFQQHGKIHRVRLNSKLLWLQRAWETALITRPYAPSLLTATCLASSDC